VSGEPIESAFQDLAVSVKPTLALGSPYELAIELFEVVYLATQTLC
jgi:hypothetical protein